MRDLHLPIILAVTLSGCTSVASIPSPASSNTDGLIYYMPRIDFVVTIVKTKDQTTQVTVAPTNAYPDLSTQYVLNHRGNLLGANALNVGVDVNGLLKLSKSSVTSGVNEALTSLGQSLGIIHGLRLAPSKSATDVCGIGAHIFIYDYTNWKDQKPCGLNIQIKKLIETRTSQHNKVANKSYSGIFYRQAEPYLVTVTGEINTAAIVLSPNESPAHFLPVSRTLFSKNEADFTFTNGMPTQYNQTTEGEIVALFKIPASVVAAYFSAIGTIFDSFKSRDAKEAETLTASIKLELAKKKYEACLTAIVAKDDAALAKLECGK